MLLKGKMLSTGKDKKKITLIFCWYLLKNKSQTSSLNSNTWNPLLPLCADSSNGVSEPSYQTPKKQNNGWNYPETAQGYQPVNSSTKAWGSHRTFATSAMTTACLLYYTHINSVSAATPLGQPLLHKAINLSLTTHSILQLPLEKQTSTAAPLFF